MFSQNLAGYEEHILCLHKCIEYAQRTRAYIHGDIYNIEYLMSVLSLAAITNPELQFMVDKKTINVSKALEVLKELVWRVYSRMDNISEWHNIYYTFTRPLNQFIAAENNSIDIITTNYDVLPEMIMYRLGQSATMSVDFESMALPDKTILQDYLDKYGEIYTIYNQSGRHNLHKLHGSVNWFFKKSKNFKGVLCSDKVFCRKKAGPMLGIPFCTTEFAIIPKGYLPVIVPPSMIKEYKIPVIQKAWQDASGAIAEADKIIFIGYSFPPTDTIMKFFLGTSLANNRSGCRITIIDKYANTVMSSLKEIFVDDICRHHIDPINVEFENLFETDFSPFPEFTKYLKS